MIRDKSLPFDLTLAQVPQLGEAIPCKHRGKGRSGGDFLHYILDDSGTSGQSQAEVGEQE